MTIAPAGILTDEAKAAVESAFQGGAADVGKVLSDRKVTVQSYTGREVLVDTKNGPLTSRMIWVGNRLYKITAGGKPGLVPDRDVQIFFDSFKVLD